MTQCEKVSNYLKGRLGRLSKCQLAPKLLRVGLARHSSPVLGRKGGLRMMRLIFSFEYPCHLCWALRIICTSGQLVCIQQI